MAFLQKICHRSLRRLRIALLRTYFISLRRPRLMFSGFLTLFLAMGFFVTKLRTNIAIEKILPSHFQSVSRLKELIQYYPEKRSVMVGFYRKDQDYLSQPELCQIKHFITGLAKEVPELERIESIFSLRKAKDDGESLYYPNVVPDVCLDQTVRLPLVELRGSPWEGIFYSEDQKLVLAQFEFSDDAKDPKFEVFSDKVYSDFDSRIQAFKARFAGIGVLQSGTAPFEAYMIRGIERFGVLNLVLLFVLMFLHRFFYGTWKAGLLFLISLLISGVLLHGGIALFGGSLDFVTNSLFLMIAVATLQDFTFLSFFKMKRGFHFQKVFLHFLIPGFFTSLTTIIGFGSLVTSELENIKLFGISAAMGAGIEWLVVFFFLPALMSLFPFFQDWTDAEKAFAPRFQIGLLHWPRKWTMAISMLLILLAPFSLQKIEIADEPNWALPKDHPYRIDQEILRQKLDWEYPLSLVIEDAHRSEVAAKLNSYLDSQTYITRKESLAATLAYINKDVSPDIANFVTFQLSSGGLLGRLESRDSNTQRIILYLQGGNNQKTQQIENDIGAICPKAECWAAGILDTYVDYVSRVSHTLIESLFVSFFLVLLTIAWVLGARGFQNAGAIVLSILFGPAALCAGLALSQIPVNMNTTICMSVIVGLSGDNALQFLLSKRRRLAGAVELKSAAAIVTGLMMAMTSVIFLFSYLEPPRQLGILLILSFLICLFGDVFVLKSLIARKASDNAQY